MQTIPVLILCGGKGTRSYPFTEYFPKAMMPINGSPIIVHLMWIYASQGFNHFILSAGHRKEMLYDYFKDRFSEWNVQIVDTGADADTGDRILRCADHLPDTFMATYADGLGDVDLPALLEYHRASAAKATLTTVPLRSQYGLVGFSPDGQVTHFVEKPVVSQCWINAGYFVFQKSAFQHWKGHNLESQILPELARQNELYTFRHEGFWKSMDTSKDQQELEDLYATGSAPWTRHPAAAKAAAAKAC